MRIIYTCLLSYLRKHCLCLGEQCGKYIVLPRPCNHIYLCELITYANTSGEDLIDDLLITKQHHEPCVL